MNFFSRKEKVDSASISKQYVDHAYNTPEFPFLISFPRTGSHWLRMLMELYFEKPSLTRSFYYHDAKEFTCLHHHDVELKLFRSNVLYLYREPTATIYSQLKYYKEDINNLHRIKYWAILYGLHLEKYLINDDFTKSKTVITYQGLTNNISEEFKKICDYFNEPFDEKKLETVISKVDKQKLKEKTKHDEQVVNLSNNYAEKKVEFVNNYSEFIHNTIYSINPKLKNIF